MNQSNLQINAVTEFKYRGRKVEIKEVMGRSALKNGYAIYIDGFSWAWGWKSKTAARKNATRLIDQAIKDHMIEKE